MVVIAIFAEILIVIQNDKLSVVHFIPNNIIIIVILQLMAIRHGGGSSAPPAPPLQLTRCLKWNPLENINCKVI